MTARRDAFGCPVEEFEIQFIDGDDLEGELAKAMSLSQANMSRYLELIEDSDEDELTRLIIGLSECYDLGTFDTDSIEIYDVEYLADLADQFIDEGIYGEVPENLRNYLDTEMMGRDLGYDGYVETKVGSRRLIYRMQ